MRITDRVQRIAWRQTRGIEPQIKALQARFPTIESAKIIAFARGLHILQQYIHLLNENGLGLLTLVSNVFEQNKDWEVFEQILPDLPSVQNPRLDIYKPPFSEETLNNPYFQRFKLAFNDHGGIALYK